MKTNYKPKKIQINVLTNVEKSYEYNGIIGNLIQEIVDNVEEDYSKTVKSLSNKPNFKKYLNTRLYQYMIVFIPMDTGNLSGASRSIPYPREPLNENVRISSYGITFYGYKKKSYYTKKNSYEKNISKLKEDYEKKSQELKSEWDKTKSDNSEKYQHYRSIISKRQDLEKHFAKKGLDNIEYYSTFSKITKAKKLEKVARFNYGISKNKNKKARERYFDFKNEYKHNVKKEKIKLRNSRTTSYDKQNSYAEAVYYGEYDFSLTHHKNATSYWNTEVNAEDLLFSGKNEWMLEEIESCISLNDNPNTIAEKLYSKTLKGSNFFYG